MASKQYGLSFVEVIGASPDPQITGITSVRFNSNLSEITPSSDGNINPTLAMAMTQSSRIRFTTNDIKGALDVAGFNGLAIGTTVTPMGFNFRARLAGGQYDPNDGFSIVMPSGLLIPIGLRASHGQVAEIEMEAIPVSTDGVAAPLALDSGIVSTVGNTPTRVWTIGPWYINAVLLEGIREFNLEFGIDVELLEADAIPWPTQASIKQRRPTFSCQTFHLDQVDKDALALIGQIRSGVTRAFLRRKGTGAANSPDATANHIRFDVAEGRISMRDVGAGHPESASVAIMVTPTKTGSTDPIAVNTAAAINTGA